MYRHRTVLVSARWRSGGDWRPGDPHDEDQPIADAFAEAFADAFAEAFEQGADRVLEQGLLHRSCGGSGQWLCHARDPALPGGLPQADLCLVRVSGGRGPRSRSDPARSAGADLDRPPCGACRPRACAPGVRGHHHHGHLPHRHQQRESGTDGYERHRYPDPRPGGLPHGRHDGRGSRSHLPHRLGTGGSHRTGREQPRAVRREPAGLGGRGPTWHHRHTPGWLERDSSDRRLRWRIPGPGPDLRQGSRPDAVHPRHLARRRRGR
ncbi:MAG: hypothetical protein QOE58_1716 [Actinomycetota bacterium]|nr:hypothetical protein [Actinomycetota bacterium]